MRLLRCVRTGHRTLHPRQGRGASASGNRPAITGWCCTANNSCDKLRRGVAHKPKGGARIRRRSNIQTVETIGSKWLDFIICADLLQLCELTLSPSTHQSLRTKSYGKRQPRTRSDRMVLLLHDSRWCRSSEVLFTGRSWRPAAVVANTSTVRKLGEAVRVLFVINRHDRDW